MKKLFALLICLALLFTLVACDLPFGKQSIDFGKKYGLGSTYFVFNADHTGYYRYYKAPEEYSEYTLSGRIDFEWREADDGTVYLFKTNTEYYEDHTEGKTISLPTAPSTFGDDFLVYVSSNQYGIYNNRFIKKDSKLAKALED